jgi:hypothetical protein
MFFFKTPGPFINRCIGLGVTYAGLNISTNSKLKLAEIKCSHSYRSHDEALWRVMNNDTNRKY